MNLRQAAKRRKEYVERNFERLQSGELTFKRVAFDIECSFEHVQTIYNKIAMERARMQVLEMRINEPKPEPKIVQMFRHREPQCVREFELEKRIEVHPKRVEEVGGKIVLTYESRLNYEGL
jgi:hypothetical protein